MNKTKIIHNAAKRSFSIVYPSGIVTKWVLHDHDIKDMSPIVGSVYISPYHQGREVPLEMYHSQVADVVSEAIRSDKMYGVEKININIMSNPDTTAGNHDVFDNVYFRENTISIREAVTDAAWRSMIGMGIAFPDVKVNIFSSFPKVIEGVQIDDLVGMQCLYETLKSTVEIYVSLRQNSMTVESAMKMIARSNLPYTIQQSCTDDVDSLVAAIKKYGLTAPRIRYVVVNGGGYDNVQKVMGAFGPSNEKRRSKFYTPYHLL